MTASLPLDQAATAGTLQFRVGVAPFLLRRTSVVSTANWNVSRCRRSRRGARGGGPQGRRAAHGRSRRAGPGQPESQAPHRQDTKLLGKGVGRTMKARAACGPACDSSKRSGCWRQGGEMHPEGALIAGMGSMTLPTVQAVARLVGGGHQAQLGRAPRHHRPARRTPVRGGSQQHALPRRH